MKAIKISIFFMITIICLIVVFSQIINYKTEALSYLKMSTYPETGDLIKEANNLIESLGYNETFQTREHRYFIKQAIEQDKISLKNYLYILYISNDSKECKNIISQRTLPEDYLSCKKLNKILNEFPNAYINREFYRNKSIYIPVEELSEDEFKYYNNMRGVFPAISLVNNAWNPINTEFCLEHKHACKFVYVLED